MRLLSIDGVPGSNYINANFIHGYHKEKAYIATQAPLVNTFHDFWRMVWESNSRVVVMLTGLIEKGKVSFYTAEKMKFFIKDFFSKYDQICSFLRMWSHLLKKILKGKLRFLYSAIHF